MNPSNYSLLIGGEFVSTRQYMGIINPATEKVIGECPLASEEQLNDAVNAASTAFPVWSKTPIETRRGHLIKAAQLIEDNAELLGHILTAEQGKPLSSAIAEVKRFSYFTRETAEMDLPVEILESSAIRHVEIHRDPLGIVAAIIPWNFPLLLLGFKLGPALLAGNTIIVKPAPTTPLSTLKFAELTRDVFPPGVLNVITGSESIGSSITAHPGIRKIAFTGSMSTGVKVVKNSATTLKRLTLELGGNDAALVLDSVDPKVIAPKLIQAAFGNSGQVCISIKRLYVPDSIYEIMCDELVGVLLSKTTGDGMDSDVDFGPLQNRDQFKKVQSIILEAKENGRVIAGGEVIDRDGYFIEPTLIRDISEGVRLVDEEQFGPVLPIIKYFDPNEAIERINQSSYGLGASVWSNDLKIAREFALRMDAGTVWINKHPEIDPSIPLGGSKASGIGTELGKDGLYEFTQKRVINMSLDP